jgi:hypothetical protein
MFQDEQEELTRLQEALLEEDEEAFEEDWEEIEDFDDCVYNADRCDEDLDDYAERVLNEEEQGVSGLTITALLLALGVLGVILWFLLKYWI